MSRRATGTLAALLCAASAGFCLTVGKLAFASADLAPIALSFYLFAFALPMTGLICVVRDGRIPAPPTGGPALRLLLIHSAVAFGAIWTAWEAVKLLDPTVAGFLSRFEVPVTVGLGVLLLSERFGRAAGLGAILTLAGVAVMGWPSGGDIEARWTGILLMTASSVGFGVMEVVAKVAVRHMAPTALAFYRSVLLASAFGLVAVMLGTVESLPLDTLGLVALTAFLGPVLARLFYLVALRHLEVSWTALLTQTSPLFTASLAAVTVGELPTTLEWIGGALILAGCVALVRGKIVTPG